jgi:P-type Cu+ transporter
MKSFAATTIAILLLAACSTHTTYSHHKKTEPSESAVARTTDPVCGMEVNPKASPREEYQGRTFYFCSEGCEEEFKKSPAAYVRPRDADVHVK